MSILPPLCRQDTDEWRGNRERNLSNILKAPVWRDPLSNVKELLVTALRRPTWVLYTHMHTRTSIHIHTNIHILMRTYTNMHMHAYTYTHIHPHTYMYTHTHMHTHAYTHIHIWTHMHTQSRKKFLPVVLLLEKLKKKPLFLMCVCVLSAVVLTEFYLFKGNRTCMHST